jgi:hypothetical protein
VEAAEAAPSCALPDGRVLDVSGRADGVYAVRGERVDREPLVSFSSMTLSETGVDAESGKRWLQVHIADAEGEALQRFTSETDDIAIAVVIDGGLASTHKIRAALTSNDVQMSCCNPAACERWLAMLRHVGDASSESPEL